MASLHKSVAAVAAVLSVASALYINGSVTAPCSSPLYCQGDVLKAIQLAAPFSDSKTFVDMPTIHPLDEVIAAFNNLTQPVVNGSELNDFLATYFGQAGGELESVPEDQLQTNPVFLDKLNDTVIKEFVQKVIKIWPDLTRQYVGAANCSGCVDSFIPVNRTFVVAGGRFREYYYWDSFWILEGLLRTGGAFIDISKNIIENFLDLVEQLGFVPNGGRLYYMNRSQPPMLAQMVRIYVEQTNDTSILDRALPLLIKEHDFWVENRTIGVTAANGQTYQLNRYQVENNQPRPESYLEDWITVNNHSYYSMSGIIYPETKPLNDSQQAALYANLATGAESGWDYGTRWLANPDDAARDVYFPLRSLNVVNIVPVCLNSILYDNEVTIAGFLNQTGNATAAQQWANLAEQRSEGMFALMWNDTLWSYFDYNLTSNSQRIYIPADSDATPAEEETAPAGDQVLFSPAQFYPFWTGAAPVQLKNNPLAVKLAYQRVEALLDLNPGGIPATNFETGQQWDEPNVWPPLQHVLMQGLLNTPPTFGADDPAYIDIQNMSLRIAQRYLDSTFCTWYATGGSTSQTPQLAGLGPQDNGTIFEKYADNATNVAGGGGEYAVVEGFGWSNGVLIWAADTFGARLTRPDCGNITAADVTPGKRKRAAVELDGWDAEWTKRFGGRAGGTVFG